jgi:hypothetical protein
MERIGKALKLVVVTVAMVSCMVLTAGDGNKDENSRYWSWGWGTYGLGTNLANNPDNALDNARFDWTFICFGNDPADQSAVDRCNEILKLNPKHKFVIRVWSIGGLGDCKENRNQATFLHYLYAPGVREKLLAETRRQIELIVKGVSIPESVVGCTFLEELPGHFSSAPFGGRWKAGEDLPWDIKRFQKEIAAELGETFDMMNPKHRQWWGQQYVKVISEINKTMKEASGGRIVIYYQETNQVALDQVEDGQQAYKNRPPYAVIPIHYADILKPGLCDGIFGYPNNQTVWDQQTLSIARKLKCCFFSQISQPPGMRLSKLEEMTALARVEMPGNLGAFIFPTAGRKIRAWNELTYQDDSYWTYVDHIRKFGWDNKIGIDIVDRALQPRISADYKCSGTSKTGFIHLQAQVLNPRDPSWYGGSADRATMKNLKVTLSVPDGFSIPHENNAGPTLTLGDLAAQECRALDWWVRLDKDTPEIPAGKGFLISVAADNGVQGKQLYTGADQTVPSFETHLLFRSGDSWVEPFYRGEPFPLVAELRSLRNDILFPQLDGGYRKVVYRDILPPYTRLRIGPGAKATLLPDPLFEEATLHFSPHKANAEGAVEFKDGYLLYGAGPVKVHSGESYKIKLTGWSPDGGQPLVVARFEGNKNGKNESSDMQAICASFTKEKTTAESPEIKVPIFDKGDVRLRFYFYRFQSKGSLFLESFDCRRTDIPEAGLDVSSRLEGILADLVPPFTTWIYRDLSDPVETWPKISVRFLAPAEQKTSGSTSVK